MNLSPAELSELAEIAISAATEAGAMIARSRPTDIGRKAGAASLASEVVTEIDRASEALILDALSPTLDRFELGLLTEERDDNGSRLTTDHFWCIDPLDGTLPFIEGSPGYSVSIALVGRDGAPKVGVVYDPVEATLFHATSGGGAFRNRAPWPTQPQGSSEVLSVFADRSFTERDDHGVVMDALGQIATDLGLAGVRQHGSLGGVLNACGVLAHPPACYVKFPAPRGGGSSWDFAATACLFHEAGAVATDIHGDPLDLNRPDSTAMNHRGVLFATDETLAAKLRALHANAGG